MVNGCEGLPGVLGKGSCVACFLELGGSAPGWHPHFMRVRLPGCCIWGPEVGLGWTRGFWPAPAAEWAAAAGELPQAGASASVAARRVLQGMPGTLGWVKAHQLGRTGFRV